MGYDDKGLRLSAGYITAADIFAFARRTSNDALTQLLDRSGSPVDLVMRLAHDGPEGKTRLEFKDGTTIFEAEGLLKPIQLTAADLTGRGLRFVVTLNAGKHKTPAAAVETLVHEYAGHAAPWAPYLLQMLDNPAEYGDGRALTAAMAKELQGATQHTAMRLGNAPQFASLVKVVSTYLEDQVKTWTRTAAEFDAEVHRDVTTLNRFESLDILRAATMELSTDDEEDANDEDTAEQTDPGEKEEDVLAFMTQLKHDNQG